MRWGICQRVNKSSSNYTFHCRYLFAVKERGHLGSLSGSAQERIPEASNRRVNTGREESNSESVSGGVKGRVGSPGRVLHQASKTPDSENRKGPGWSRWDCFSESARVCSSFRRTGWAPPSSRESPGPGIMWFLSSRRRSWTRLNADISLQSKMLCSSESGGRVL
jgi:hypothetical protein